LANVVEGGIIVLKKGATYVMPTNSFTSLLLLRVRMALAIRKQSSQHREVVT
jgi:hypothetical protein